VHAAASRASAGARRVAIERQARVAKSDVDAVGLASHPRRRVSEQERLSEMRLREGDLDEASLQYLVLHLLHLFL